MGILNTTPDSFSDGGLHFSLQDALDASFRMIDEGADIIDIGGESTRPGSNEVSAEEELRRVIPVIEKLEGKTTISIDTSKPDVAKQALAAGATIVNDIRALTAPGIVELCAKAKCKVCLMHMKGEPKTMQIAPTYKNVVSEVRDFLIDRATQIIAEGVDKGNIWLDPGIGFGKTAAHNLKLLKHIDQFVETGFPILIGVSRKSFIGKILGTESAADRLEGTLAAQVLAQVKGAEIIRAHDVKAARRAIDMTAAILSQS